MVLLLGLALLAGLSLLALMAANSMLQQEQMAANHADSELARLSAMTALNAGEQFLLALPAMARVENCSSDCFSDAMQYPVHEPGSVPLHPEFQPDDWWSEWGQTPDPADATTDGDSATGAAWSLPGRHPPRFILEELQFLASAELPIEENAPLISGIAYYRILGRGTGIAASSTHVAESIIAKPWPLLSVENQLEGIDCKAFRPWFDCGRMAYRVRR